MWERAENVPDKTYVKSSSNTLYDSMELVRFYISLYHLPLQLAYNINHIEQSGINENNRLKIIMNMCICMYVCKY